MSDEELIARLRESQSYEWQDPIWETRIVAADRIEQLAVTNEALTAKIKLMDDLDAINGEKIEALTEQLTAARAERAKAVDRALATLAEINNKG